MRTIKIYEACDWCLGLGLEEIEGHTTDCRKCSGYGENLIRVTKEDEYLREIKKATPGME